MSSPLALALLLNAGVFPPLTDYRPPAGIAPPTSSTMFVRTWTAKEVRNQVVSLPPVDATPLTIWTIPISKAGGDRPPAIEPTVRTPSGQQLTPSHPDRLEWPPKAVESYRFDAPDLGLDLSEQNAIFTPSAEPGAYSLAFGNFPEAVAGVTVVAIQPESPIVLTTSAAPLSRQHGEPVTLLAWLSRGTAPLTGATVTARVAPPGNERMAFDAVQLFDDGSHGDVEAGDGFYALEIPSLPDDPGLWVVRFEATGPDFARTSTAGFITEPHDADVESASATLTDVALRVRVTANILKPGNYRLDVTVFEVQHGCALAWGENVMDLGDGKRELPPLDVPLDEFGAYGDDLRFEIRLLNLDDDGTAAEMIVPLTR